MTALRELRARLGLTQEQAAKRLGVDRTVWNQWENDKRGIGPKSAARIAQEFGGDPRDYLTQQRGFSETLLGSIVERLEQDPASVQELRPLLQELSAALHGLAHRLEVLAEGQASGTPPEQ